ncbi:MAG: hypothetical protein ABSF34_03060, partial [Verrucomicrobiota bacterium]
MKMNYCLLLGVLVAASAVAQDSTNSLPPIPAPANVTAAPVAPEAAPAETNAPVKKATIRHHKKTAKKAASKKTAKKAV